MSTLNNMSRQGAMWYVALMDDNDIDVTIEVPFQNGPAVVTVKGAVDTMRPHESVADTVPEIEKVIWNPPATIVLWKDGTKTVVKCSECHLGEGSGECTVRCQNMRSWREKGLMHAMLRRTVGSGYLNELKKAMR